MTVVKNRGSQLDYKEQETHGIYKRSLYIDVTAIHNNTDMVQDTPLY